MSDEFEPLDPTSAASQAEVVQNNDASLAATPAETAPADAVPHEVTMDDMVKQIEEQKSDPRVSATREETMALNPKRAERIPMGRQERLEAIGAPYMRPDLYLRFVLDKPGRLEQHLSAWYDFVLDSSGKHVKFPSGSMHLHLMKLPIEIRKKDLADREAEISNRLVKEIKIGHEEYTPDGQKTALTASGMFEPID